MLDIASEVKKYIKSIYGATITKFALIKGTDPTRR